LPKSAVVKEVVAQPVSVIAPVAMKLSRRMGVDCRDG